MNSNHWSPYPEQLHNSLSERERDDQMTNSTSLGITSDPNFPCIQTWRAFEPDEDARTTLIRGWVEMRPPPGGFPETREDPEESLRTKLEPPTLPPTHLQSLAPNCLRLIDTVHYQLRTLQVGPVHSNTSYPGVYVHTYTGGQSVN